MDYKTGKPTALLSDFVKHYWAMDNCKSTNYEHIQRIVPSGLPELIFYFEDKPQSNDDTKTVTENSLITGQLNKYYDLTISGRISLFSIIFKPLGLSAFLDIPASELFDKNIPLKYLFKNNINEIENKLYAANTFDDKVKIIETYLLQILKKKNANPDFERLNKCLEQINVSKGHIDINSLASEACYSRRQFERQFLEMVGISPKKFLKIIRFQNAIYRKSRMGNIKLSGLTYECGYFDQAHMINDFKKLSGLTPKKYFDECEPYSDYFQD